MKYPPYLFLSDSRTLKSNMDNMRHSRENLSSEVCDQVRLELARLATEASQGLGISDIATIGILLSRQRDLSCPT